MKALIVALLLIAQSTQPAAPKTLIILNVTGTDRVGTAFVYALKEEIANSSRYSLDYAVNMAHRKWLMVYIVSMDSDKPDTGTSSIVSVVAEKTEGDAPYCAELMTHLALHIGSEKSKSMARDVIATIDRDFAASK